ncbi:E3 ubiquitin-protein ligase RNF8 [Gastrophryne carolinensis]
MADEEEEERGGLCWCLRRVGGSEERLLLTEGEEVTVGRGVGVTYQLVSGACPLMISRTHCIFRQNPEGQWSVTDNGSLNGVWVNKERLEPQKPRLLTRGCSVQLGVPLQNQDRAEFEYELVQENPTQIRPFLFRAAQGKGRAPRNKRKLSCDESEASGTEGTSKAKVQRVAREGKPQKVALTKQATVKMAAEGADPDCYIDSEAMASTQQHGPDALQLTKMRESIAELRGLNARVREKQAAVQEQMRSPEESTSRGNEGLQSAQRELHKLQRRLSNKREQHLQRVNELQQIFNEELDRQSLPGVSKPTEEHVKEQLAQALQEHSLLMDELNRSHQDFEQIIQAKNRELQETKKEKERMEAQKEEVLSHMNDVLDNELQCIICSEHFIEAVTLNCAHSFCAFCIQAWRQRKDECPICRQQITSHTRSLVLDNCINRMVDKLSQEMRDRRLALILERKGERSSAGDDRQQEAVQATPIPIPDSDSSSALSNASFLSSMEDSDCPEDDDGFATDDSVLPLDSDSDDFPIFDM